MACIRSRHKKSDVCSVMRETAETRNREKQTEPKEDRHSETSRNDKENGDRQTIESKRNKKRNDFP